MRDWQRILFNEDTFVSYRVHMRRLVGSLIWYHTCSTIPQTIFHKHFVDIRTLEHSRDKERIIRSNGLLMLPNAASEPLSGLLCQKMFEKVLPKSLIVCFTKWCAVLKKKTRYRRFCLSVFLGANWLYPVDSFRQFLKILLWDVITHPIMDTHFCGQ